MPIDLLNMDSATAMPSVELNAAVAEWCEPKPTYSGAVPVDAIQYSPDGWWYWKWAPDGKSAWAPNKAPSTNAAHAGEARRRADGSYLDHLPKGQKCCAYIEGHAPFYCKYSETNGDKGRAEALAICRAILSAIQAKEKNRE